MDIMASESEGLSRRTERVGLPSSSASNRMKRVAVGTGMVVGPQVVLGIGEHLAWGGNPMNWWPISTPRGWTPHEVTTDIVVSSVIAVGSYVGARAATRAMKRAQDRPAPPQSLAE